MDELTIKVVEVKKIQADVTIGTTKCRTRELLTFFPQVCINKSNSAYIRVSGCTFKGQK